MSKSDNAPMNVFLALKAIDSVVFKNYSSIPMSMVAEWVQEPLETDIICVDSIMHPVVFDLKNFTAQVDLEDSQVMTTHMIGSLSNKPLMCQTLNYLPSWTGQQYPHSRIGVSSAVMLALRTISLAARYRTAGVDIHTHSSWIDYGVPVGVFKKARAVARRHNQLIENVIGSILATNLSVGRWEDNETEIETRIIGPLMMELATNKHPLKPTNRDLQKINSYTTSPRPDLWGKSIWMKKLDETQSIRLQRTFGFTDV